MTTQKYAIAHAAARMRCKDDDGEAAALAWMCKGFCLVVSGSGDDEARYTAKTNYAGASRVTELSLRVD
jgi:hypothetical protein